jgi:choline dehydrogenase
LARQAVPTTITAAYDHIVVGGGTAGCIVAARLSAQPGCRVLLVEAGGMDITRPAMVDPSLWRDNWRTDADWLYHTVPQAGLDGRIIEWNRGKVIGGSSTINAMAWVWGHAADFDGWAAAGNPGWDFASLLPVFQRMERCQDAGKQMARGHDGPMEIFSFSAGDPLIASFLETCRATGHAVHEDGGGQTRAGGAPAEMTLCNDQRFSVAQAYLQPVLGRDNLTVLAHTEIDSLMFEGTRCLGIRCKVEDENREIRSLGDVVLTTGVIETPRLLLLAGIGPSHDLTRLGIGVRVDLPGVGGNLQDHCQLAAVVAEAPPAGRSPRPLAHLFTASGRRRPGGRPGLDLCLTLAQSTAAPADAPSGAGFTLLVGLFRPDSRGRLSLTAAERHAPLQIDPRYLAEPADLSALCEGAREAAELGSAAALAPWRIGEAKGPPADRAGLRDFVRQRTGTYRHPVGTCAMGTAALRSWMRACACVASPISASPTTRSCRVCRSAIRWPQPWPLPRKRPT